MQIPAIQLQQRTDTFCWKTVIPWAACCQWNLLIIEWINMEAFMLAFDAVLCRLLGNRRCLTEFILISFEGKTQTWRRIMSRLLFFHLGASTIKVTMKSWFMTITRLSVISNKLVSMGYDLNDSSFRNWSVLSCRPVRSGRFPRLIPDTHVISADWLWPDLQHRLTAPNALGDWLAWGHLHGIWVYIALLDVWT